MTEPITTHGLRRAVTNAQKRIENGFDTIIVRIRPVLSISIYELREKRIVVT